MKLKDQLKDKAYLFIIRFVALIISVIFLAAFKVRYEVYIALAVIFVLGTLTADLCDLNRKRKFYNTLYNALNSLDKKYLLPEMLPEADFLEGDLLKDVLASCSKSMAENVAFYRIRNREFREYIEMWVHEAKIPVATLELICRNNPDIREKIARLEREINELITSAPYIYKILLADPAKVEKKKEALQTEMKDYDDYIQELQEQLDEMLMASGRRITWRMNLH